MLKVGDLTQNQSNTIFSDSSSINLTPVVSAEWNQNIFNPPYLTVSGDASTTGITIGTPTVTPTGATVANITDINLVKPNFTTKSITTATGTVSLTYPITTNSKKAYKVVFFAKTNNPLPLMLSAYADGTPNGSSSAEINSFGWTKIETYVGATSNISSFNYIITGNRMSNDTLEHTIYFSVPQVYETTYFDYQYHSIYPTDMVFTNFRPGESYVRTGNDQYLFPDNFRRIQNQILNTETLSGGYYGNKYMPVTSVINNPSFTLATIPVPVYKNILVSDMSPYKYFVSDLSSTGNPKISAIYESSIYSNKIIIKFNALMAVPQFTLTIDGTIQTVDSSTTIIPDDNGVLILYWTGTAWTKTKWSTMPIFNEYGSLSKYTTLSKITIEQTNKTVRSSFTSYASSSTHVSNDLTRMQIVEISPRLEIDLTDYIENVSINKSLDSASSVVPISSINSNDATITISNIPINKANLYTPLFSSQSNLSETILKNILRKNIKLYVNFKLNSSSVSSSNSFSSSAKIIPGGVFYSDSWQENDIDNVTVQAYDISRYLQSTPVPDYVANLKSVFEIITNILDLAGYTDYDYDSLYNICNSKTMPLDLAYYYCNSKDTTLVGALSEIFIAYQIGAYIDEYGVMKFLSLSNILSNTTSSITITDNDIIKDGYSISNNAKPGKISLRYQPPKIKQSPAIQNVADPKYKNSPSFIYTTSNDVVWSQQNIDSVGYNYLSESCLKNTNKFKINVPSSYDIFHTYNLDANNFAAIEDEIVSFAYKEYTISNSSGSVTVAVKSYIELQAEINNFIKKYSSSLKISNKTITNAVGSGTTVTYTANNNFVVGQKVYIFNILPKAYNTYGVVSSVTSTSFSITSTATGSYISGGEVIADTGYDVIVAPTGNITNVKRGLFGTKIKDHTILSTPSTISDKGLSQATCSSSYSITTGTSTATPKPDTTDYTINIAPTLNTKTLIYPTTDVDSGYKTYSTKFKFEDTDVSSSGLFFNLTSTSSAEGAYFLELTRYSLEQDSKGNNIYKYIIALYSIVSGAPEIIAWMDATTTVYKILSNLPQVFKPNGTNKYKKIVDESLHLRLSHYTSQTDDGEDVGELISIFLNNVELVGWKVPSNESYIDANITGIVSDAYNPIYPRIVFTANNDFSVGDTVQISGVDPSIYNGTYELSSVTSNNFKAEGIYSSAYVSGGIAKVIDSEVAKIWETVEVNEITKLFKKISLPTSISSGSKYGYFSSTKSIASIIRLVDDTNLIPASSTTISSYLNEIYACEKPLKQRSVNYYFQDREFLNGLVQGYNLANIKTFTMQTKPAVYGINYYDVQYTNPAAVSVDVLPIEYLFQYFPGDLPGDQKWFQQLKVNEHSLSYSTPINTGFRARMAIANSVPHLVFLNKDSSSTESATVRLNLWTHEIVAPSDQEIIEKVLDYSNISEVAQIDSEWIQSKDAAYKILGIIEKSIDGFSKTVSLNIFGNPLIQVGDIITLTYTKNGINQQKYLVKQISHSFENGLITQLSLNQLSTGTSYSQSLLPTTISISPSISTLNYTNTQQFSAIAYDQYGNALSVQPTFTWSTNVGSISSTGLYTPSMPYGNIEIKATSNSIFGLTEFNVPSPIYYSVKFYEQGGSAVSDTSYTAGSSITLPAAPTRSGYTFNGWFTAASGGSALTSPYYPPGTGNIVLYAQWTATIYSVTYDEGGGSAVSDTTYTIGSSITLPSASTYPEYTFDGWFTAPTGGTALTSPYYPSGIGNITLYAQRTAIVYSLTYSGNGNTSGSEPLTEFNGLGDTIPVSTLGNLEKTNSSFVSWNTESDGTGINYNPEDIITITGNITLYAIWLSDFMIEFNYPFEDNTLPINTIDNSLNYLMSDIGSYDNLADYSYSPTFSLSNEEFYSGAKSLKIEWNQNQQAPTVYLYNGDNNPFDGVDINRVTLSAWVYVPAGSPDVQINYGYYGQHGVNTEETLSIPFDVTSLKDQWVKLELDLSKYYLLSNYGADINLFQLNIEPDYNNLSAGTVYVDDINIKVYTATGTIILFNGNGQEYGQAPSPYWYKNQSGEYSVLNSLCKDGYLISSWNSLSDGTGENYDISYGPSYTYSPFNSHDQIILYNNSIGNGIINLYAKWSPSVMYETSYNFDSSTLGDSSSSPTYISYSEDIVTFDNMYGYSSEVTSEQSYSGTQSFKNTWSESGVGEQITLNSYESKDLNFDKIHITTKVYIPLGSPDIKLAYYPINDSGYVTYNGPEISTSLKDQWVTLTLNVTKEQLFNDYGYTMENIQNAKPLILQGENNIDAGVVYVDDFNIQKYSDYDRYVVVIYNLDGGTKNSYDLDGNLISSSLLYNDVIIKGLVLQNSDQYNNLSIEKNNEIFVGWNTELDGSGYGSNFMFNNTSSSILPRFIIDEEYSPLLNNSIEYANNGILNLYAQYSPTRTITFNKNGSTIGTFPVFYKLGNNNLETVDFSNRLMKNNEVFVEWNTQSNGTGTSYKPNAYFYTYYNGSYFLGYSEDIQISNNINLYAIYSEYKTITFDSNGGDGSTNPNIAAIGRPHVLIGNPQPNRSGYTFNGWNTQVDGSGTNYLTGQVITISDNITLYAKWI